MSFFYVIMENYSVMFLLHKNALRGCDQMQMEYVCYLVEK
ncbi:hypothetical protein RUMOBE_00020 [Blautia obeum ATCC 29174]|uniref:Uncharacterized protein n=1 Tax=Blautia obeum ATCC 29174 TaxID=411459 RepID=A5ZM03_9FIRM|nr:hypothetical protein RUMOBE_00020 [Blautia obeum ATCC 29174]